MKTMKNFKRRAIALLLAVLMCLSMMNLTVFAEETTEDEVTEPVYICGLEEHTHNDECYKTQIVKDLVCDNKDEDHEHTDECYAPVLDCGLEEGEGAHAHTDDCYGIETKTTDKQVLTCELAESDPVEASEGHKHGEGCYENAEETVLTCTDESEDHTHTEECYKTTTVSKLTCELVESEPVEASAGHTHTEECYTTESKTVEKKTLTCELEESEGHQHSDACYKTEKVLVCKLDAHTHTAACYAVVKEFIDKVNALPETLPEEMSQDEYDALKANMEALLALYGEVQDLEVPGWDEYEPFMTAYNKVLELWEASEGVTPETMVEVDNLSKLQGQMTGDKLNNDVTVKNTIEIAGDFTLDLNGHTVTYTGATGSVFEVISGTFTLNNSGAVASVTVDNTGTVTEVTGGAIWGGKGTEGTEPHVFERPAYWKDGHTLGGAVFVRYTGTFVMNGGTLAGNTAFAGGAIYVDIMDVDNSKGAVDVPGHLYINGGVITYNTATGTGHAYESGGGCDGGGGGIWINGYAEINPTIANVEISHNKSMTNSDLGGGGIYVNNPGELRVTNAVITQNTAVGLGGGVAGCVHGKISLINSSGAAIYDNTGNGTALDLSSAWGTATDGHLAWHKNGTIVEGFVDKAQDILGAGSVNAGASGTVVSNERFDGEMHNWIGMVTDSKDADFREITAENNGAVYGGYVLGLTAQNKNPVNPGGRSMVVISNNSSQTYGGGIGCNGKLIIGSTTTEMTLKDLSGSMTLDVYKSLKVEGTQSTMPIKAKQFTFALVDENGVQIPGTETATNDASGKVTLHYGPVLKKENDNYKSSYEFYVKETGLASDSIKNDLSVYKVVVEVGKIGDTVKKEIGDFMIVYMETYGVTNTTITKVKDENGNGNDIPNGTPITDAPTFVNKWKTSSLTIDKTVVSPTELKDNEKFVFTVSIPGIPNGEYDTDRENDKVTFANGEAKVEIYGSEFAPDGENEKASVTITGIPYGLTYTVHETDVEKWNVEGQDKSGTIGTDLTAEITNKWKTGSLTINKTVVGGGAVAENKTFGFSLEAGNKETKAILSGKTFKWTKQDGTEGTLTFGANGKATVTGSSSYNALTVNGSESVTVLGLPADVTLKVGEYRDVNIEGYSHTVSPGWSQTLDLKCDSEKESFSFTAAFTNTYTRDTGDLSITKIVEGLETAQQGVEHTFTFTVKAEDKLVGEVKNQTFNDDTSPTPQPVIKFDENGVGKVQIKVTGNKSETKTIKGLPTGTYNVTETEYDGEDHYTCSSSGSVEVKVVQGDTPAKAEITNTYSEIKDNEVALKITKVLSGPASSTKEFTFKIEGKTVYGEDVEKTLTVKGASFNEIALTKGTYTITEVQPENETGYTWSKVEFTSGDNDRFEIKDGKATIDLTDADSTDTLVVTATNTYTRDLGDLKIDKHVVNNTPLAADEVFKFEVTLTPVAGETLPETLKDSDGNEYTVDKDGKFTVTISGMELNNEYRGNKYVTIKGIPTGTKYAVTEVDAGKWIVTSENGEGEISLVESVAEITNTYRPTVNTTRLSVKKVWKGDGDIERPASVTVQLYRDGQASTRNDAVQTLNASNNWSYSWTGLNENYSWSVDEIDVPENYTREVTNTGTRFTITNTYTEPEIPEDPTPLTSLLSVSKVWVGDAGENRPASVSVQFYKDGERAETVTLNDANGWSWSRALSKEELASKWTVSEVEVPAGYTSVVTTGEDGISFTVTNTFTTTPEKPEEPETPDTPDEPKQPDTPDEPVEVPDEQPPLAEIPDEQPPLVDWPPLAEIPEEQPPLVEVPEEIPLIPAEPEVTVPEEPVPMVGIPQTGDFSMVWYAVAILSALGLVVLTLKKREDSKD